MATSKAAKIQAEIEKTKARLAEQQAKLKELETKKTEVENMEIVDIVRGMSIPLDELAAFLQTVKGGKAQPATSTGQIVLKPTVPPPAKTAAIDKEDKSE
jgi:predicted RNase H-like nuclease (RuvC/YqgF family)